jgi:RecB family exonuclease
MDQLPTLDHISYSHLNMLACPYSAFLRYEARIKGAPTVYIVLGNALHEVLEKAHKEQNFSLQEWVKDFKRFYNDEIEQNEVFVNYPTLRKLENDGIGMLEGYHGQIESGQITKYPLDVEKEFRIPVAGTFLVGRIDKTEDEDDGLTVIDYKSGAKAPDPWLLRHNLQLTAYFWAAFEIYGRWPTRVAWHHLRTGEILYTTRTQDDVENLKKMIQNAVTMREQGIRHRVYNSSICGDGSGRGVSCDFRGPICDDPELEERTVAKLVAQR